MESIGALELPVQLFVVGTAAGIAVAIVRYHVTGDLSRWPLIVGYAGLIGFGIGAVAAAVQ